MKYFSEKCTWFQRRLFFCQNKKVPPNKKFPHLVITPFCFTVFLTEEALKKHNMYPFVLQRAVGMEKVDSWLLTAKHYENKKNPVILSTL